jgi:HAE1 family hydrophobic/amphiphilic exporter-1
MSFHSGRRERPKRVFFVFLGTLLAAVIYGSGIPMGYLPRGGVNFISVLVEYRGAFETEIERTITIPLENILAEIPGVAEMFSLSDRERCRVHLRFTDEVSLDDAYLDVREAVHGLYPELPEAVQRPVITKSDPRDRPIFAAAFGPSRDVSAGELKRLFESVPGAGEVETGGEIKREILIRLDQEKAAAGGIPFFDVLETLRDANIVGGFGPEGGPAGVVDRRLSTPRDFRDLYIAPGLKLGDAAEADYAEARRDSLARIDGEERLVLYVRRAGDANPLLLSRRLRALAEALPCSRVLYDQGAEIRTALEEILHALLFGVFLIIVLTVLFLRRPLLAAAVCLNIPFSGFIALAFLRAAGYELDVMTLSGLAVGAGLAVDSGILFGEEFLSRGFSARRALEEVKDPIIYSSLTTVCVFTPLLFASPPLTGTFGGLALAVTSGLLASLLYVFHFMPAFLTGLFRGVPLPADPAPPHVRPFPDLLPSLCRRFITALARRRGPVAAVLLVLGGAAAFTVGDFTFKGPGGHRGNGISFTVEYESGLPLGGVITSASPFEDRLRRIPGALRVMAKYERERASFDMELQNPSFRPRIIDEVRRLGTTLGEGFLYFPEGEDDRDSFEIVLCGPEARRLRETAMDFAEELRRLPEAEGVVFHFKEALPSKNIVINPDAALRAGIEPARAAAVLHWAMSAPVADKIILPEEELDLRLTVSRDRVNAASKVLSFPVEGKGGTPVRISVFARMEEKPEAGRIYRTNRRRSVSFSVVTLPADSGRAVRAAEALAARYPFPDEYTADIAGAKRREKGILKEAVFSLLLALVFLGIILAFQFENAAVPLVILAQLPFCLACPVLLLRLFGTNFTAPAALGLIMTLGIAVNNSLLVFRRENRRDLSLPVLSESFAEKSRPMLTAALTTVGGVLPLLFTGGTGTKVLAPLSLVIAVGTATSPFVLAAAAALIGKRHS